MLFVNTLEVSLAIVIGLSFGVVMIHIVGLICSEFTDIVNTFTWIIKHKRATCPNCKEEIKWEP